MSVHYRIKITTNNGMYWYSSTRGLVHFYDEWHLASRFDSRDAVEVAIRLLKKRTSWLGHFIQWKRVENLQ